MKRSSLLLVLSFFFVPGLWAQDQHFTQFYAAPLTLNPALTGTSGGQYRLALIYRDQWRNFLDEPYHTFAGAMDFRFGMRLRGRRLKDAFGAGVLFFNDRVPSINFYTTQISVSLAYHKALNAYENQFLTLGFQGGISQRNISYGNLRFDDQFNGSDGYTEPTAEDLPENNFSFADYAVGLNYSYLPSRNSGIFAGFALHHFHQPLITFYRESEDPERIGKEELLMKITAHLAFQLPLSEGIQFLPRALVYKQGPHLAANAGANFRFLVNDIRGTAFHVGGWARPVHNEDNRFSLDAVVGMAGFEYNNFLFGFSYDANLQSLTSGGRRQGAFEFSIAYLGNYDNETVLCPKF